MQKILTKKIIMVIIAVIILLLILGFFIRPKHIKAVPAENITLVPVIKGTGYVYGDSEHTVYSSVSGIVEDTFVNTGDRISENHVLLSYTGEEQQQELNLAKTDVKYSEKILDAAKANRAKYQKKYDDTAKREQNYRNVYGILENQIRELDTKGYLNSITVQNMHNRYQHDIAEVEKELENKRTKLQRIQYKLNSAELLEDEVEFKDLTKDAKKTTVEIEELNEKAAVLKKGEFCLPAENLSAEEHDKYVLLEQQLDIAAKEWAQARSDRDTSQSMLTALSEIYANEQQLEKSRQRLDKAENEMGRAINGEKSAFDGIITQKFVDKGSVVDKGQPLFTIQSVNYYRVRMKVSKFDISKIKIGQSANVNIGDISYNGTVSDISQSAAAEEAGKPKAYVDIKINTDEDMIVGFEAEATVFTEQIENTLCVPVESIYSDDRGSYLYAIENEILERKYVVTGADDGKLIQVMDGIKAGEIIASEPAAADYEGNWVYYDK